MARQARYAKKSQLPKQTFFLIPIFFDSSHENKKWCVKKCSEERRKKNYFTVGIKWKR